MKEVISFAAGLIIASVAWMFMGLTDSVSEQSLTHFNASFICYSIDKETGWIEQLLWEEKNGNFVIHCKNGAVVEVALILHKEANNVLYRNRNASLPSQIYIHYQEAERAIDITTGLPDSKLHYGGR